MFPNSIHGRAINGGKNEENAERKKKKKEREVNKRKEKNIKNEG